MPFTHRATASLWLAAVCVGSALAAGDLQAADQLHLDAESLFAQGVSRRLRLSDDHRAVELMRGELYEDDGPAAGYSYQPNEERIGPDVLIKKEFVIRDPRAREATLLVAPGGELTARINGRETPLEPLGKQGGYWRAYRFPAGALQPGENQLVLGGEGKIWIARDEDYAAGSLTRTRHPNRSAKSIDDGQTWSDRRLGADDNIDGEYYVRVFLDQYNSQGELTSSVIDAGNLAGEPIGPPVSKIGPIRIEPDLRAGGDTAIHIRARTGTSYTPNEKDWSSWLKLDPDEAVIDAPRGRYLQLQFELATDDPLSTPALHGLSIFASPRRPVDWTKALEVVEAENGRVVRSSIPFQYEPFDQPQLAELRKQENLDRIVEGAEAEFEIIKRLAAWSSSRWRRMHLGESYPPWNSLEILKPHADGSPVGGFCQQHAVVFLQACESFGIAGRMVSVGPGNMTDRFRSGHETTEIWSNDYQKWIYVDGDKGWLLVDEETQTPLSLWELRQRQLALLSDREHRPVEVVDLTDTEGEWAGLGRWPSLVELRLIPRSNFLQQAAPLPLNQGMRGWFWTGHYVWTDSLAPARMIYSHRVAKRENFEWTLNQTHAVFEAREPGALRVHLDTQTPGFKTFLKRIDGEQEEAVDSSFNWRLHPGKNELEAASQNVALRKGSPARWVIAAPDTYPAD